MGVALGVSVGVAVGVNVSVGVLVRVGVSVAVGPNKAPSPPGRDTRPRMMIAPTIKTTNAVSHVAELPGNLRVSGAVVAETPSDGGSAGGKGAEDETGVPSRRVGRSETVSELVQSLVAGG